MQTKFSKHAKTIEYAIQKIQKSEIAPYIEDVILYGSCARHQEKYNSDIDLLIILTDDVHMTHDLRKSLRNVQMDLEPLEENMSAVDSKIIRKRTYDTSNSVYYSVIRKEGISLWNQKKII